MAGTSKAHASKARHRSRASASDPEAKKPTEASFTFSTKARTASLPSSPAVAGTTGQAKMKASNNADIRRAASSADFDLSQAALKNRGMISTFGECGATGRSACYSLVAVRQHARQNRPDDERTSYAGARSDGTCRGPEESRGSRTTAADTSPPPSCAKDGELLARGGADALVAQRARRGGRDRYQARQHQGADLRQWTRAALGSRLPARRAHARDREGGTGCASSTKTASYRSR